MLKGKSILITGGTGTLGRALTKELLKQFPSIEARLRKLEEK